MPQGIIVKAISGFFYVQGSSGQRMECRGRGRFKNSDTDLLVGDLVHYEADADGRGIVTELVPRRHRMVRPPVANVDQAVMTFAFVRPPLHRQMLDRLLVLAERDHIASLVVLNKADLATPGQVEELCHTYHLAHYPVVVTSTEQGLGIAQLTEHLQGKISVLAGPSGVGKSSLLNAVQPGLHLVTGSVSERIGRGRHTTRHSELLALPGGGMVADTPGFYDLEMSGITSRELAWYFPEMRSALGHCRFGASCLHDREPDCAVKDLLAAGNIAQTRYESYLMLLNEAKLSERKY